MAFSIRKQQRAQKKHLDSTKAKKRILIGGERGFSKTNTIISSKTSNMHHFFRLCALEKQLLINPESEEIISLVFEKGEVHNFQLLKSSQIHLKAGSQLTADSGYQGLTSTQIQFCRKVYQKSTLIEARSKTEQKYLKKTYRC